MKYYETSYEDYVNTNEKYNIHPELNDTIECLPESIDKFNNIIIYGPPGVGKYTQALKIIKKYSSNNLKTDRKLSIMNEKNEKKNKSSESKKKSTGKGSKIMDSPKKTEYTYRTSDIHYEIDMSCLGCNAKTLWHDIFFQILDVISVKKHKYGIILCKNFHSIYNELLDVFNSYIRHPLKHLNIQLYFILLTEHIGFIPDVITNSFYKIRIKRPTCEEYIKSINNQSINISGVKESYNITNNENIMLSNTLQEITASSITNIKELHLLKKKRISEIPEDVSNKIADIIINKIAKPEKINITQFRNDMYDLLIYNTDVIECISYIIFTFIQQDVFKDNQTINDIMIQTFTFLKYYNNNYRPIYHLESIIYFIIKKIHYNIDI